MALKTCFVDSTCWIALLNKSDHLHKAACMKYEELIISGCYFVTTTSVLTETANSVSSPEFRETVIEFDKCVNNSLDINVVSVGDKLWQAGWHMYSNCNRSWSLVDCISFVVMDEHNIRDALTSDLNFIQAGYNAILCSI